jgi:hypothetical protein
MGQGYGDLEEFDHDRFLDSIFKDRVYEKTGEQLTPSEVSSVDDISKESVIEIQNMDPQSQRIVRETTTDDVDSLMKNEEQSSPSPISKPELKEISDEKKMIDGQLNHAPEKEKLKSIVATNEPKPKGGSFFNKLFKENKDKEDTDNGKENTIDTIQTKKEKNKKENRSKSESGNENENENDGVVYLTDDDINDLIK